MTLAMIAFDEPPGPLTVDDLACLVQLGWAEPVGHTEDGAVTSYALTPQGRAVLQNQRYREPEVAL